MSQVLSELQTCRYFVLWTLLETEVNFVIFLLLKSILCFSTAVHISCSNFKRMFQYIVKFHIIDDIAPSHIIMSHCYPNKEDISAPHWRPKFKSWEVEVGFVLGKTAWIRFSQVLLFLMPQLGTCMDFIFHRKLALLVGNMKCSRNMCSKTL